MIDSIGPTKPASIPKIKRVIRDEDKSTTAKSNEKVAAEDSAESSGKEERKGSFIDEQV